MDFDYLYNSIEARGSLYSDFVAKPRVQWPCRVIAFYLPQFHPIPENDRFWGRGFTEWRNVTRALPQFRGHYQPHLPSDLGFYDLRCDEVMSEQVRIARNYGVDGFAFHYYWFDGRPVMDLPIKRFLARPELDQKFCICWANENWDRRWDGSNEEVLLAQTYSPEDDLRFLESLQPFFADPRYIRVEGRPLLIVYRPGLFPDPIATVRRWRELSDRLGVPAPYLVSVQFREVLDPRAVGFDAAVEFPPHTVRGMGRPRIPKLINEKLELFNRNFAGQVFDYEEVVECQIGSYQLDYPLFRCASPAWDNTPRSRAGAPVLFANSQPQAFFKWMYYLLLDAVSRKPDHRMVFVNAWNEWAEGTHLEPDLRFGYGYLEAIWQALSQTRARFPATEVTIKSTPPPISITDGTLPKPEATPSTRARLLAFYLPQFHPIPENDRWWGKGFTEWTNVTKAVPLFPNHHQPQLPADLGFYDLRLPEARLAQAELARKHSIEGFCYWHYWFNGKRLLERPFNEVLASGQPDFPFCLAWANESWSRRWLGEERDLLMEQTYSLQDDIAHARWLTKAFADRRYIRVQGRPLFLIYRPTHLPDPQRTTDILRQECLRAGLPEPYLVGTNAHCKGADCRTFGFDGTVDFEPKLGMLPGAFVDETALDGVTPKLKVYECAYARLVTVKLKPDFPAWYPSIFVGWDNTPRRGARGIIIANCTPESFAAGLADMVQAAQAKPHEDRLIFLNAWNEWAEGNHLEPDLKHGLKFLEAVRKINT